MGKKEIYDFLNKNPNAFFSADDLSKILKINYQSARAAINKLITENTLVSKNVTVNKFGPAISYFSIRKTDDKLEEALIEYKQLRNDPAFAASNQDLIIGLLQVKELKKLNEVLQNGCRK